MLVLLTVTIYAQAQKIFRSLPASQTNISFSNTVRETSNLNIIAYEYFYNGGGVGLGDFNNDGLIDIYFTGKHASRKALSE